MQVPNSTDAIESVLERSESRRLRQQHEDTIHAFIKVGVFLGFK